MKRAKHSGDHWTDCPACTAKADHERDQPAEIGWSIEQRDERMRREHKKAIARRERDQAMRDLGMTRTPYGWE